MFVLHGTMPTIEALHGRAAGRAGDRRRSQCLHESAHCAPAGNTPPEVAGKVPSCLLLRPGDQSAQLTRRDYFVAAIQALHYCANISRRHPPGIDIDIQEGWTL